MSPKPLTSWNAQFHAQRSTDVSPGQRVDDSHGTSACDLEYFDNGEFVGHSISIPAVGCLKSTRINYRFSPAWAARFGSFLRS
jgi:hypothetical protein